MQHDKTVAEVVVDCLKRHGVDTVFSQSLPSGVVLAAEDAGWNGDFIEAEAFAYLAARSAKGLPLSLPTTTGVPAPITGGKFHKAV